VGARDARSAAPHEPVIYEILPMAGFSLWSSSGGDGHWRGAGLKGRANITPCVTPWRGCIPFPCCREHLLPPLPVFSTDSHCDKALYFADPLTQSNFQLAIFLQRIIPRHLQALDLLARCRQFLRNDRRIFSTAAVTLPATLATFPPAAALAGSPDCRQSRHRTDRSQPERRCHRNRTGHRRP
jgi:hypothetical protein